MVANDAHRQKLFDWIASAVLIVVCVVAVPSGMFDVEDAGVYFFYNQNVAHGTFPYFYAGYVSLVPQAVGWLAAHLPMWVQPAIYVASAMAIGVWFVHAMVRYGRSYCPTGLFAPTAAAAFALFLPFSHVFQSYYVNLTYAIWTLLFVVALRVFRMARGEETGSIAMVFYCLAALSHPYCVGLLIPLALVMVVTESRRIRIEAAIYAVAVLVFFAVFVDRSHRTLIEPAVMLDQIRLLFIAHGNVYSALGTACFLFLAGLVAKLSLSYLTNPAAIRATADRWIVGVFGMECMVFYVASSRFATAEFVGSHYMSAIVFCAVMAVIPMAAPLVARMAGRRLDAVLGLGIVVMALVVAGVSVRRGAFGEGWRSIAATERFLLASERYLATCTDGATILMRDRWAPIVLCKKIDATQDVAAFAERLNVDYFQPLRMDVPRSLPADNRPRLFLPGVEFTLVGK